MTSIISLQMYVCTTIFISQVQHFKMKYSFHVSFTRQIFQLMKAYEKNIYSALFLTSMAIYETLSKPKAVPKRFYFSKLILWCNKTIHSYIPRTVKKFTLNDAELYCGFFVLLYITRQDDYLSNEPSITITSSFQDIFQLDHQH